MCENRLNVIQYAVNRILCMFIHIYIYEIEFEIDIYKLLDERT